MSTRARVLVAGIGNVFLADDGFGVEVAARLAARAAELPPGVEVADIGIRGMHLAYRLLDGYDTLVLVDTVQRGDRPGTLYLLEHDLDRPDADGARFDAHGMDPSSVLAMLDQLADGVGLDRPVRRVLVLGCEPASLDDRLGLSEPVTEALDRAVARLVDLVTELTRPETAHPGGTHHDPPAVRGAAGRGPGRDHRVAP